MNVTRRNNGLAITGSDNEIIALLASLEYGLYAQAGVESKLRGEDAKAATAVYLARHREAKQLRMRAESLQSESEKDLHISPDQPIAGGDPRPFAPPTR